MNPDPQFPPPPVSSDPELAAFLTALLPRRDIPQKLLRAAYAQIAPIHLLAISVTFLVCSGILICFAMVVFTPFTILRNEALSRKHATASGVVLSVKHPGGPMAAFDYGFQGEFAFAFTPASTNGAPAFEAAGICYGYDQLCKEGDQVTVEYDHEDITIARIRGTRLCKADIPEYWLARIAPLALLAFMLIMGVGTGLRFLMLRARCRRLMENGVVNEFLVVGYYLVRRLNAWGEQAVPCTYVFQLKPANGDDGQRSYFSRYARNGPINYAIAVLVSKTVTLGLYDPNGSKSKRQVFLVETWFHDTKN